LQLWAFRIRDERGFLGPDQGAVIDWAAGWPRKELSVLRLILVGKKFRQFQPAGELHMPTRVGVSSGLVGQAFLAFEVICGHYPALQVAGMIQPICVIWVVMIEV